MTPLASGAGPGEAEGSLVCLRAGADRGASIGFIERFHRPRYFLDQRKRCELELTEENKWEVKQSPMDRCNRRHLSRLVSIILSIYLWPRSMGVMHAFEFDFEGRPTAWVPEIRLQNRCSEWASSTKSTEFMWESPQYHLLLSRKVHLSFSIPRPQLHHHFREAEMRTNGVWTLVIEAVFAFYLLYSPLAEPRNHACVWTLNKSFFSRTNRAYVVKNCRNSNPNPICSVRWAFSRSICASTCGGCLGSFFKLHSQNLDVGRASGLVPQTRI